MPRAATRSASASAVISIVADAVPPSRLPAIFVEYNKYLLGRAADLIGI
jgi:hypothetical protein